jgi:hypothetical protein
MSRREDSYAAPTAIHVYYQLTNLKQLAAIKFSEAVSAAPIPNSNFWYLLTGIRIWLNETPSCIEET